MSNLRTSKKRGRRKIAAKIILRTTTSSAHGGVMYYFAGYGKSWRPIRRRLRSLAKNTKFLSKKLLGNIDEAAERRIRRLTLRRIAKLAGNLFSVRSVYRAIQHKLGAHVELRARCCIEKLLRRFVPQ